MNASRIILTEEKKKKVVEIFKKLFPDLDIEAQSNNFEFKITEKLETASRVAWRNAIEILLYMIPEALGIGILVVDLSSPDKLYDDIVDRYNMSLNSEKKEKAYVQPNLYYRSCEGYCD